MADRDIELNITATDDASPVLDKVAAAVDELDGDATVEIDADVGGAQSEIEKFESKLDAITSDRGREVLIEFRGKRLESEIKSATRALDRLEDPVEIDVKRSELERAQSELEDLQRLSREKYDVDITVDARQVGRAADDVGRMGASAEGLQRGVGPLRGFTDELGDSSAAAGTAANAMVDAGEAVEIFGAQAGISQKLLGKLSLAMGVAGVAFAGLSVAWKRAAREGDAAKAFRTDQVEAYADALEDAENGVDAIVRKIRDAGKVELRLPYSDVEDITADLTRAGLSLEAFAELAEGGQPAINAWGEAQRRNGTYTEATTTAMAALLTESVNYQEALEAQAITAEFMADKTGETGANLDNATRAAQDLDRGGIQPLAASVDTVIEKTERIDDGFDAATVAAGELDREIRGIDNERRGIRLRQDFEKFSLILLDGKRSADEQSLALLDLKDSVAEYAEAIDLPPFVTTELLAKIDAGGAADVQRFLDRIGDGITLPIRPYIIPNSQGGGIRVDENGNVSNIGRSAPAPTNVTVNLPRSAAGPDVIASVNRWNRYNGRA